MPPKPRELPELTQLGDEWLQKLTVRSGGDRLLGSVLFVQNFKSIPLEAYASSSSGNWQEAAKERRKKVLFKELNVNCHQAYNSVHELVQAGVRYQHPIPEAKAWELLPSVKWSTVEAARRSGIDPSGPFLNEADFCERELGKAALLNEERGFFKRIGIPKVFEQTADFMSILEKGGQVDRRPAKPTEIADRDGETERVIVQDCIRTFRQEDHQSRLEKFINGAFIEFGNYSQGMCHVAAMLLLTLNEHQVMSILRRLNSEVVSGHWDHEAVGFAVTSYLWADVCKEIEPDHSVFDHLAKINILPEMYTGKWFKSLLVHALDVEHWYPFMRNLLTHGYPYLLAFGICAVKALKDRVLATQSHSTIMKLFALDQNAGVSAQEARQMVSDALDYVQRVEAELAPAEALQARKDAIYDTHLKERMEKARKAAETAEEDQEHVEDCPLTGEPCGKVVKYAIKGGPQDGDYLCAGCKKPCQDAGYAVEAW